MTSSELLIWGFRIRHLQQRSVQQEVGQLRRPRFAPTLSQARKWTETKNAIGQQRARLKPEHLSPQEVAAEMKVTRRTVYRWLESGALPAIPVGRTWQISHQDLEKKKRE